MGEVIAPLAMSLDGFIADPDDSCEELFGFYQAGDAAVKLSEVFPELHVSQTTAGLLTTSVAGTGATVVGRPREGRQHRRRHGQPRLPGRGAAGCDPRQPGTGDPRLPVSGGWPAPAAWCDWPIPR